MVPETLLTRYVRSTGYDREKVINEILRQWIICKKHGGKAYYYPEEFPLSKERATSDFAPSYVGIGYAGPLFVKSLYCKEHDVMYKAWVVLVTCAKSRGIYSDLVTDCTSKCCVDALKRFVNSRGTPKIVISDNWKYFISTDVQNFATSSGIYWKFNIESVPWYGGFFERLSSVPTRR